MIIIELRNSELRTNDTDNYSDNNNDNNYN